MKVTAAAGRQALACEPARHRHRAALADGERHPGERGGRQLHRARQRARSSRTTTPARTPRSPPRPARRARRTASPRSAASRRRSAGSEATRSASDGARARRSPTATSINSTHAHVRSRTAASGCGSARRSVSSAISSTFRTAPRSPRTRRRTAGFRRASRLTAHRVDDILRGRGRPLLPVNEEPAGGRPSGHRNDPVGLARSSGGIVGSQGCPCRRRRSSHRAPSPSTSSTIVAGRPIVAGDRARHGARRGGRASRPRPSPS